MKNQMEIWDSNCTTNPAFTKYVKQRGGFTAIDAYYQIRQATELWGPYGASWGLKNIKEEILKDYDIALIHADFFYPFEDKTYSFEIGNSIYIIKKGTEDLPDDEFIKKLETNTISKALSRLGFGADVFLGKFDDSRYIQELNEKFGNEVRTKQLNISKNLETKITFSDKKPEMPK